MPPELTPAKAAQVARQLRAASTEELVLTGVCETANAASYRAEAGSGRVFLKLFREGAAARQAFQREFQALKVFAGDLVPGILAADPDSGFLMTDFIQGRTLADSVTRDNLAQMAEFLGNWLGRLANQAPSQEQVGDWAGYLGQYADGFSSEVLAEHHPLLAGRAIGRMILARNDNALSNFILAPNRRLYGVDFEHSRMKPEGWDLVTAARAFLDLVPQEFDTIVASLVRGYRLTVSQSGLGDDFDAVIRVLITANLLSFAASSP